MPYSDKKIDNLIINKISKSKYNEIKQTTGVGEDEVYIRKDSDILGLPEYSNKGSHILKVSADGTDIEWVQSIDENAVKFETIDDMINNLNNANPEDYSVNQTIYILERGVPDFWIYSIDNVSEAGIKPLDWDEEPYFKFGYYLISPLEPSKVVVNSNITYSETEPVNSKIGDIWLSPTTAEVYDLPAYDISTSGKVLSVNDTGLLVWKEEEGGTGGTVKVDAPTLSGIITGSENIIVDLSEDSSKLEIHLDENIGNSISAIESNIDEIEANILNKQDKLISGSNIKTINNENILGTGNIEISYNDLTDKPEIPSISGLASTSYVDQKVSSVIDSSPDTLNTLKELATAIGNDPDFVNTITTEVNKKVNTDDLSDVAFTGDYGSLTNTPSNLSQFNDDIGVKDKLDKVNTIDTVYGVDGNGAQKSFDISENINAESIPLRDNNGNLKVSTPIYSSDAVSKEYLDNIEAALVNGNPDLAGGEKLLSGIDIKGTKYKLLDSYTELKNLPVIPSIDGLATEVYVNQKVAALVNSAPETLDTLGELATAFQDNQEVIQALNTSISNKQDISTAYNTSNIIYSETEPSNPSEGMIWAKPTPEIVFSETQPENPVEGMIWLKPV